MNSILFHTKSFSSLTLIILSSMLLTNKHVVLYKELYFFHLRQTLVPKNIHTLIFSLSFINQFSCPVGYILRRIGHVHCMSLVLLAFGIRFILYSILVDPWWCLPIELFQGLTFGLFFSTMASYASVVSPPGTEATVQGLVGALFEGVGKLRGH